MRWPRASLAIHNGDVGSSERRSSLHYRCSLPARRRREWFDANGPCTRCASWENLHLHHRDPSQKVSHKVWSWRDERRVVELAKCEVVCASCHRRIHRGGPTHNLTGYQRGCRCADCRAAKAAQARRYRARRPRVKRERRRGVAQWYDKAVFVHADEPEGIDTVA
jgi:hypothetical protein